MTRCKYCDVSINANKQGMWGVACSGCKGTLTRRLRSEKYTRKQLLASRYDWTKAKWII